MICLLTKLSSNFCKRFNCLLKSMGLFKPTQNQFRPLRALSFHWFSKLHSTSCEKFKLINSLNKLVPKSWEPIVLQNFDRITQRFFNSSFWEPNAKTISTKTASFQAWIVRITQLQFVCSRKRMKANCQSGKKRITLKALIELFQVWSFAGLQGLQSCFYSAKKVDGVELEAWEIYSMPD